MTPSRKRKADDDATSQAASDSDAARTTKRSCTIEALRKIATPTLRRSPQTRSLSALPKILERLSPSPSDDDTPEDPRSTDAAGATDGQDADVVEGNTLSTDGGVKAPATVDVDHSPSAGQEGSAPAESSENLPITPESKSSDIAADSTLNEDENESDTDGSDSSDDSSDDDDLIITINEADDLTIDSFLQHVPSINDVTANKITVDRIFKRQQERKEKPDDIIQSFNGVVSDIRMAKMKTKWLEAQAEALRKTIARKEEERKNPGGSTEPAIQVARIRALVNIVGVKNATDPDITREFPGDIDSKAVIYHSTGAQTTPPSGVYFDKCYGDNPEGRLPSLGGIYYKPGPDPYSVNYGEPYLALRRSDASSSPPEYVGSSFQTMDFPERKVHIDAAREETEALASKLSGLCEARGITIYAEPKDALIVHSEQRSILVSIDADGNADVDSDGSPLLPNLVYKTTRPSTESTAESKKRKVSGTESVAALSGPAAKDTPDPAAPRQRREELHKIETHILDDSKLPPHLVEMVAEYYDGCVAGEDVRTAAFSCDPNEFAVSFAFDMSAGTDSSLPKVPPGCTIVAVEVVGKKSESTSKKHEADHTPTEKPNSTNNKGQPQETTDRNSRRPSIDQESSVQPEAATKKRKPSDTLAEQLQPQRNTKRLRIQDGSTSQPINAENDTVITVSNLTSNKIDVATTPTSGASAIQARPKAVPRSRKPTESTLTIKMPDGGARFTADKPRFGPKKPASTTASHNTATAKNINGGSIRKDIEKERLDVATEPKSTLPPTQRNAMHAGLNVTVNIASQMDSMTPHMEATRKRRHGDTVRPADTTQPGCAARDVYANGPRGPRKMATPRGPRGGTYVPPQLRKANGAENMPFARDDFAQGLERERQHQCDMEEEKRSKRRRR